jgi:hypothetical protein
VGAWTRRRGTKKIARWRQSFPASRIDCIQFQSHATQINAGKCKSCGARCVLPTHSLLARSLAVPQPLPQCSPMRRHHRWPIPAGSGKCSRRGPPTQHQILLVHRSHTLPPPIPPIPRQSLAPALGSAYSTPVNGPARLRKDSQSRQGRLPCAPPPGDYGRGGARIHFSLPPWSSSLLCKRGAGWRNCAATHDCRWGCVKDELLVASPSFCCRVPASMGNFCRCLPGAPPRAPAAAQDARMLSATHTTCCRSVRSLLLLLHFLLQKKMCLCSC